MENHLSEVTMVNKCGGHVLLFFLHFLLSLNIFKTYLFPILPRQPLRTFTASAAQAVSTASESICALFARARGNSVCTGESS